MSPRKPSKKKASKAKPKPKKAAKKGKPARRAKATPKKASRKPARRGGPPSKTGHSAPVVFRRKGTESGAGDTVDTLGEWQHDHEIDTEKYTEDDIPPDYGGSE